jgi:NAD(P)-dependent dehydrogenase (short-subunit alcohol dehydrogenase family)
MTLEAKSGAAPRRAVIASISSDIGFALAGHWLDRGFSLGGTYRRRTARLEALAARGVKLASCDFAEAGSVDDAAASLREACPDWDVLALCAGTMEPIGPFSAVAFDEWNRSFDVNFTNQLRFLHRLLPARRSREGRPTVLLFAGGGVNGAPINTSAYTIAKIALVKACELLDAEMPDACFAIVGPGWVRTKIHEETLRAGPRAGSNLDRTTERLASDRFTPMQDVLECCDWIVSSPREIVGGRNISVVDDPWREASLAEALRAEPGAYKLRRHVGRRPAAGTKS